MTPTINILGVPLHVVTNDDIQSRLVGFLRAPGLHHIVTVNPEYIVSAQRDPRFAETLRRAELSVIDGVGIIFVAKLLRLPVMLHHRCTGVQLTKLLLLLADRNNLRVLVVLPDNPLSSSHAITTTIQNKYPHVSVVAEHTTQLTVAKLSELKPDLVFTALGAPQQDFWIQDHITDLPHTKIAVGVGGTFDFLTGRVRRAPIVLQKLGLEWAWRLVLKPTRLVRILRAVVVFPYLALRRTQH